MPFSYPPNDITVQVMASKIRATVILMSGLLSELHTEFRSQTCNALICTPKHIMCLHI